MEFAGNVYIGPYCRVQRTVILLLGLMMILPFSHHWVMRYVASVIGFIGAVVAVNQNFMGWVKISRGEFAFSEQLYVDPYLLSGGGPVHHYWTAVAAAEQGLRRVLLSA